MLTGTLTSTNNHASLVSLCTNRPTVWGVPKMVDLKIIQTFAITNGESHDFGVPLA